MTCHVSYNIKVDALLTWMSTPNTHSTTMSFKDENPEDSKLVLSMLILQGEMSRLARLVSSPHFR